MSQPPLLVVRLLLLLLLVMLPCIGRANNRCLAMFLVLLRVLLRMRVTQRMRSRILTKAPPTPQGQRKKGVVKRWLSPRR